MLSILFFATLALADTKLNQFVDETEQTMELSAQELHSSLAPVDQLSGPPALAVNAQSLDPLRGKVRAVLGQVTAELRAQKGCRLPSSGKLAMTAAELAMLRDDAARQERLLQREEKRLSYAIRHLAETEQHGARVKYERALAGLKAYNRNLTELAEWLETPRNDGLTSELLAYKPECAGRVARLELVRRAPAGEETATAHKNLGKLRFDMDVEQLIDADTTDVR